MSTPPMMIESHGFYLNQTADVCSTKQRDKQNGCDSARWCKSGLIVLDLELDY